ncbi:MAG: hypothetical protein BroJett011_03820 [Chloroflexota bacterium]|nr:MAG: hypothetical protein BroJett011_03820 [Chloroflexota bacterium]
MIYLSRSYWYQWLAWQLPRELIYYVLIRAWAYATTGQYSNTVISEISMDEAIRRWGTEK